LYVLFKSKGFLVYKFVHVLYTGRFACFLLCRLLRCASRLAYGE